jgi:CRISP-associated protein Cas1
MVDTTETPTLLPARMLNEFVYCPRLFYLEWVDDRWADNADTVEGGITHRRVDRPTGHVPEPDQADMFGRSTSLRLSSDSLGVVAVIDRVDGAGGRVVPVDIKKGHPAPDGQPWEADRVQVLVHALLLRESRYRVDECAIFYAETRQRAVVHITDEALDQTRGLICQARLVAQQALPPPPLIDSPQMPAVLTRRTMPA